MTLKNLQTINNEWMDVHLPEEENVEIKFDDAIFFPGLTNSHDHLDFNLFPQLGNKKYNNYTEWGKHIHTHYKKEIEEVLSVPIELRTQWGIYKNLLCGVTTVVNHGKKLGIQNPLINVHQKGQSLHSIKFEKSWKWKLNNVFRRKEDCIIHVAEGIDEVSKKEADELIHWNLLNRDLIGIHGLSMTTKQSQKFKAVVWCPMSNDFLFDRTAPVQNFHTEILFGTDSTLTGDWNIWEHLRLAKSTDFVNDRKIFDMLTSNANRVWNLFPDEPSNHPKNIVVAKAKRKKALESFFEINPEDILIVICNGRIRLIDERIAEQNVLKGKNFCSIKIGSEIKFVEGDLQQLVHQIKSYYSKATFPFSFETVAKCSNFYI